jgi:hypothetical protein
MSDFDYSAAGVPIREDLREAHRFLWEHVRSPGTWWSGGERVAIAAESRKAAECALCRERKAALSPNAESGRHDTVGGLPENVVDVIHRIRTDPARLSKAWFENVIAGGLEETRYVELVSVVTLLTGVDCCARALGIAQLPLPEPAAGEPSHRRPVSAKPGPAWVPMIAPEDAGGSEADLYGNMSMVPNIMRALSLVPAEAGACQ